MCRFPGRRIFEWALLLPLAIPAYVIAYTYTGLLDFVGPVQSFAARCLRLDRRDYWFPQIRSLAGAIAMLTLVLYPYVYLLSRAAFLEQSVCVLEVSRTLGTRRRGAASSRVALPLARPAIVAGVALVLMETLNDFGTVQYFGVDTFTTGIYRTWLGMGEPAAAAQLAAILHALRLRADRARALVARRAPAAPHHQPLSRRCRATACAARRAALALRRLLRCRCCSASCAGGGAGRSGDRNRRRARRRRALLRLCRQQLAARGVAAALAVVVALVIAYGLRLRPSRAADGGGAHRRDGLRRAGLGDRGRRADPVRRGSTTASTR